MASDKVKMILKARGAPFSDAELEALPDGKGWHWIYEHKKLLDRDTRPRICFTGQADAEKVRLRQQAERCGFKAVTTVTTDLMFLVYGENAGPAKLKKAEAQGVTIIPTADFFGLIGELPEVG